MGQIGNQKGIFKNILRLTKMKTQHTKTDGMLLKLYQEGSLSPCQQSNHSWGWDPTDSRTVLCGCPRSGGLCCQGQGGILQDHPRLLAPALWWIPEPSPLLEPSRPDSHPRLSLLCVLPSDLEGASPLRAVALPNRPGLAAG